MQRQVKIYENQAAALNAELPAFMALRTALNDISWTTLLSSRALK